MKNFFVTALLCISHCCFSHEPPFSEAVLKYTQNNLPNFGTLKSTNTFVYVDVDDKYVHELIQFIEKSGFQKPPYFGDTDLVGAHITVIYPNEMEQYNLEQINETGSTIFFQPVECKLVTPPNWKEIDQVYFIVVDSPQLDQIREKYGLPNREYKFHITIGVKPKTADVISN
ncbi:MAG: hypothetical protein ACRCSV_04240 [Chlamydiales bacterium]